MNLTLGNITEKFLTQISEWDPSSEAIHACCYYPIWPTGCLVLTFYWPGLMHQCSGTHFGLKESKLKYSKLLISGGYSWYFCLGHLYFVQATCSYWSLVQMGHHLSKRNIIPVKNKAKKFAQKLVPNAEYCPLPAFYFTMIWTFVSAADSADCVFLCKFVSSCQEFTGISYKVINLVPW